MALLNQETCQANNAVGRNQKMVTESSDLRVDVRWLCLTAMESVELLVAQSSKTGEEFMHEDPAG